MGSGYTWTGRRVAVVGGGSGMGFAVAQAIVQQGGEVLLVGRSAARLDTACASLGAAARAHVADITVADEVRALFSAAGALDHLVCTAADLRDAYTPLPMLTTVALQRALASKVIGPILLGQHAAARLPRDGSIVWTSGIAAHRPRPKGVAVAAINAALEGVVRAMAVELAPLRVNAVSPGWVRTAIWRDVAGDGSDALLDEMAQRLPVGRVGTPEDIADAVLFLLGNGYTTGTVLHVDGGHRLV